MIRTFLVTFGLILVLGACTQRMICPAYQSAFIYDQAELRKKFSYFQDDSTPKVLTASKNKYLIAEPISYRKKIRSMQTVTMKSVPVTVPDSLSEDGDVSLAELDMAARSVMDTIVASGYQPKDTTTVEEDSIYVITKDKELRLLRYDPDSLKYNVIDVRLNVDQDNYMWYLRDVLILPDVRLAKLQQSAEGKAAKGTKEKKGIKGFFKNLFRKKKKEDAADTTTVVKPADEFDYIDENEQQNASPETPAPEKKKKGIFSFLKKNKDSDVSEAPDAAPDKPRKKKEKKAKKKKGGDEEPPPLEEEEKPAEKKDDGF